MTLSCTIKFVEKYGILYAMLYTYIIANYYCRDFNTAEVAYHLYYYYYHRIHILRISPTNKLIVSSHFVTVINQNVV